MERKLKRLGPFRSLAASLFVYDWVQDLLLHNRYIRRLAEAIFRKIR